MKPNLRIYRLLLWLESDVIDSAFILANYTKRYWRNIAANKNRCKYWQRFRTSICLFPYMTKHWKHDNNSINVTMPAPPLLFTHRIYFSYKFKYALLGSLKREKKQMLSHAGCKTSAVFPTSFNQILINMKTFVLCILPWAVFFLLHSTELVIGNFFTYFWFHAFFFGQWN